MNEQQDRLVGTSYMRMSLKNYLPCVSANSNDLNDLITTYFHQKVTNTELLAFLSQYHGVNISLSTLKRKLKNLGLRRRVNLDNKEEVTQIITNELLSSGKVLGYRKIWNIVRNNGVPVKRQTVMEILRELDPDGVDARKKRRLRRREYSVPGPDYLWHIDGYDKLKPFGFYIHGCIDGFSRKLLWLEVGSSNKDPTVVAHFYLETVTNMKRLPARIRSDDGTENSLIEPIQIALRSAHDDEYAGINSFIIGTSTANQKIESFWSQLGKDRPYWWREFFKELTRQGLLDGGNALVVECARYCFMHLIRSELNEVAIRWNQHILAPSKGSTLPRGRPDSLYFLPSLFGGTNKGHNIDLAEAEMFKCPEFSKSCEDNSEEFVEFAETVLTMKNFTQLKANNVTDALGMYMTLLESVEEYL